MNFKPHFDSSYCQGPGFLVWQISFSMEFDRRAKAATGLFFILFCIFILLVGKNCDAYCVYVKFSSMIITSFFLDVFVLCYLVESTNGSGCLPETCRSH